MTPQPFRSDSYRNPNRVRAPRTPGKGKGTGREGDRPKLGFSLAGYEMALAWAEEHLPQENGPFAAMAAMVHGSLNRGRWPTPEHVVQRLKLQGKDAASLAAKETA